MVGPPPPLTKTVNATRNIMTNSDSATPKTYWNIHATTYKRHYPMAQKIVTH